MTIFHQILGADVAGDAMVKHLEKWLTTYLAEVDEQRGLVRGFTAGPRSWQVVPRFDDTLDGQLPAMLVICPGTARKPDKLGDGTFIGTYTLGVCALVKGPDQKTSSDIAKRYGAAITACVVQKMSMEISNVEGISWEGDSYDDVPVGMDRTLTSATVHFNVEMRGVVSAHAGPYDPILTPPNGKQPQIQQYPPWGTIPDADHIQVTITPKGAS